MLRLIIELVPETCWFTNVRSNVSRQTWDKIRKQAYQDADYKCQVCEARGRLECHEVWHYDDANKMQILKGFVALCSACHEVKHIGLAGVRGRRKQAEKHLATVNEWTARQVSDYIADAFSAWRRRSSYDWQLDISLIKDM